MSNVATALKEEIARAARKEIRRETMSLKKASTAYRLEIAALKRRALEAERQRRRLSKGTGSLAPVAANEDSAENALASVPGALRLNGADLDFRQPSAIS
jgi:hypothetical protein